MSTEPSPDEVAIDAHELIRWSEALAGIARTGLGFTESNYERERYEEILEVASDIKAAVGQDPAAAVDHRAEWLRIVGSGIAGYVTPKVAVGAVVGDEEGRLLLIQRSDSAVWLYPTGWADIGYHFIVDRDGRPGRQRVLPGLRHLSVCQAS